MWLKKFKTQLKKILNTQVFVVGSALFLYLALTSTQLSTQRHQLFNLEPYPDGLFYVVPAMSWARGGSMELTYQGIVAIQPRILPIYTTVLALGYLLNPQPEIFYLTNITLGIGTLLGLYQVLKIITPSKLWQWLGLILYLSHLYIVWLPSLPMAENLGLFFFVWALWGVFQSKLETRVVVGTTLSILGLALTKYTLVGPAGVLGLFFLLKLYQKKSFKELGLSLFVFGLGLLWFVYYQTGINFNPTQLFTKAETTQVVTQAKFFGTEFILPNLIKYVQAVSGGPQLFLWLDFPFSILGAALVVLIGLVNKGLNLARYHYRLLLLLLLFVAQLPMLLPFYVADSRYIFLSIPILVLAVMQILVTVHKDKQKVAYGVLLFVILWQAVTQLGFLKYVVATNWLQRSQAWQYQAVKELDSELPDSRSILITSLPPYLFEVYGLQGYQVWPLSLHQEFANKRQPVWGSQITLKDLPLQYDQALAAGKELYISNAYLTFDSRVVADFEELKKKYDLELVKPGCQETCNLYRVMGVKK